jgi:hypothetical protein
MAGLQRIIESSSKRLALVQLADLLAGLTRFEHEKAGKRAARALENRQELLDAFHAMAENMGVRRAGRGRKIPALRLWHSKGKPKGV